MFIGGGNRLFVIWLKIQLHASPPLGRHRIEPRAGQGDTFFGFVT